MLTYLATILFIILTSFNLSKLSKLPIENFVPISVFVGIIWTTIFGIAGQLLLGASLLLPITLGWTLLILIQDKKSTKINFISFESIKNFISSPIIFFIALSAWSFKHSQYMRFYEWDEFTHWAPSVKSMFLFNVLGPASPIDLNNPNYAPGLGILSYLVVKIGGTWDEADVYWAYQVMFFSVLVPILKGFDFKKFGYFFVGVVLLIFSPLYFFNIFQSIYADGLLSVVFGFSLILATSKRTVNSRWGIFNYLVTISTLILIKDFGIVLALISISIYGVYFFSNQSDKNIQIYQGLFKSVLVTGVAFVTAFGTRYLWSEYATEEDSSIVSTSIGTANSFISQAVSEDFNQTNLLMRVFKDAVFEKSITWRSGIQVTSWQWLLIIIFLLVVSALYQKTKKQKYLDLTITGLIAGGFFVNSIAVFLSYRVLFFGEYAISLPSFERYMSVYLSGVLFFVAAKAVFELKEISQETVAADSQRKFETIFKIPLMPLMLTLSYTVHSPAGHALNFLYSPHQQSVAIANNFKLIDEKIELAQFKVDDKVGIIAQHTIGFEYYRLQYEIMPASTFKTGFNTWSIGSPSGPDDLWTDQTMTPERWNDYLNNLDYLVVYNVSQSFLDEFGIFFEDKENIANESAIYWVDHSNLGNRLIKLV